jgi:non-ribosomal peptide synthetase component F
VIPSERSLVPELQDHPSYWRDRLSGTLVASFQVLLSRYADQDDVLVAASQRSRDRVGNDPSIGPLASTVMIRTDLSGDPSFRELLGRVSDDTREAMEYKDLPFERLLEELRVERDAGDSPLPQVMFALIESATSALEGAGLLPSPPDLVGNVRAISFVS